MKVSRCLWKSASLCSNVILGHRLKIAFVLVRSITNMELPLHSPTYNAYPFFCNTSEYTPPHSFSQLSESSPSNSIAAQQCRMSLDKGECGQITLIIWIAYAQRGLLTLASLRVSSSLCVIGKLYNQFDIRMMIDFNHVRQI